ncbi:MAG TPA: MFS transporter [Albitalea sp.]|nr:MFS transporter [Albitalea sp.]
MSNTTAARPAPAVQLLLLALVLAEIVSAAESTMIFGAMRALLHDFGDPVAVGWSITAFLLVAAGSAAVGARLGDQYGRRRALLVSLVVAGCGSVLSALSDGPVGVIAGRAIQGMAGAILPLCFGLVRQHVPAERVSFGVGVVAAAAFVSGGLGIVAGGAIADHLHWTWIFIAGAGTAVVAWPAVRWLVPRDPPAARGEPVDIVGALTLLPAITALLLAPTQARQWGWADARVLGLAIGGLALLAWWVRHELRVKSPLIDVRLLGRRQLALANLGMALLALGPLQSGLVLSTLLQQPAWTGAGLGLSATVAGLVQAPPMLLAVFIGPGCGLMAARRGARAPALLASGLLAIGWIGIAIAHASLPWVAAMALLSGIGLAAVYAAAPMLIVEASPAQRTSETTGVSSVLRHLFNATGSQLVALLLASATVHDAAHGAGRYAAPQAIALTLAAISVLAIVATAITACLPRRHATQTHSSSSSPLKAVTP